MQSGGYGTFKAGHFGLTYALNIGGVIPREKMQISVSLAGLSMYTIIRVNTCPSP